MKFKRKLVTMLVLTIILVVALCFLPAYASNIHIYDQYFFYPFQSLRVLLLGFLPLSIGDVLYIAGGIWIVATVIKWVKFIVRFKTYKERLALSLLSMVNTILFLYLFFFFGWGANYYKVPLRQYWGFAPATTDSSLLHDMAYRKLLRSKDSLALISFDSFLVSNLNAYAPHYHTLSLREINRRTREYYAAYTDCKVSRFGLGIKPTFFGYFMIRLGIEGYYNPFTGEGQVDRALPAFVMPFLISHEMAHQAGIAAEDDANLVAYALGTATNDSTFRYSSYLEIWLYAHYRLYRRDSVSAKRFEKALNKLTAAHVDTLEQISRKYENQFARYSSEIYDSYLKMEDQKEGVRSYGNVASSAWRLEQQRAQGLNGRIKLP